LKAKIKFCDFIGCFRLPWTTTDWF